MPIFYWRIFGRYDLTLFSGSHILPPHLDFFNFSRDGASVEESSSNPRTPVSADQPIKTEEAREGTPESSSSSSNTNEELREISNFALVSL